MFITDNAGTGSCAATKANALGYYLHDYNDMMTVVAESMDCYVIDAGRTAGFEENLKTYLSDHIHHSEAGGESYAKAIWKGLCAIRNGEKPESGHDHRYIESVIAPTCTEQGYTTYTCICGDSYVGDYVDADGEHDFTDWYLTREATYELTGEECRDCKKCSHVEFRTVEVAVVTSGNVGKGTPYTDDVTYTLYSDGTMVISGKGTVYCSEWRGNSQPYYDYRDQVKKLIIEEGITYTMGGCFAYFVNLESVSLPNSLTRINKNAFMNSFVSTLKSITIPETVTYIADYAFGFYSGASSAIFTDVIIENPNVSFVESNAVFNSGKNLQNLTLYSYGAENNVRTYAETYGCRYIDLNDYQKGEFGDIYYEVSSGVLSLDPLVENASVSADDQPWASFNDKITRVVISEGVTSIENNAFADYTALAEVELPYTLQSIGDGAFAVSESNNTPLTMALPRRMTSLGNDLFAGRNNVNLTVYYGSLGANIAETGVNLDVKKEFKLLLIGNSYSEDASNGSHTKTSQLLDILQSMLGQDTEITVALLYSGGKGMHWHATQAEQGNSAYSFKVITTANPTWKSLGSYTSASALAWTDWDAVSLQPYNINVSTGQESVPYPDTTDPKFYHIEDSSAYMLDHVERYAPYADVYFYMHWAQTKSIVLNAVLSSYNKMAAFMPNVLDYAGTNSGKQFKTIIPVGLSIQNARSTYLALLAYNTSAYDDGTLNLTTDAQIGLQRDGGHVSFNIGRYIAALTFAETIIPEDMRAEGYVLPDIRITESVGQLPKEYSVIAQKSVLAAVNGWKSGSLAVTNIEGYTQDPTVAASELLQAIQFHLNNKDESLTTQLEAAVLAALPADFAVSKIEVDENTMTAEVTIRFGYTFAAVTVSYTTPTLVITQQPESVEQEIGKKISIAVEAEGEGLTYQWYYKDKGAKEFKVSSRKTASYTATMQSYMKGRQVYCVITDKYGNEVTTDVATITLPPEELKILSQPTDVEVELGEKFSVTLKVQGEGLTYQWYYKDKSAKEFKVSSRKTASYTATMQSYMKGRQVYCVITDQFGNQVTTDVATINLPPVKLELLSQPTDVYTVKGEKFSIGFAVQGDGLTYQWYYKDKSMKEFKVSSRKSATYAFTTQSYMNNRQVYCVITDQYGNQVTTEVATIYVNK